MQNYDITFIFKRPKQKLLLWEKSNHAVAEYELTDADLEIIEGVIWGIQKRQLAKTRLA
jgi:hypothetical protein